ncbi:DUF488 family protein [Rhizobium sp. YIM 134829]|uniref:DUF488 family protein, N3 subclade n=1 Tax=Rhizobium sp. YIM 134829 TaxID=3390453 RepID=UPI00397C8C6E
MVNDGLADREFSGDWKRETQWAILKPIGRVTSPAVEAGLRAIRSLVGRRPELATFRRIFGDHIATPAAQKAVQSVAAIASKEMTCLMCYERDRSVCHRRIVATLLQAYDFTSFDLFVDKMDRYERHPEKLPSHNSGESASPA